MFHTPNLNGWRKKYMPKRLNEGWGLQHMKLYGFDDDIMLSGANLSDDYFTNRLDRYHTFSSKELSNYYHKIHEAVCELSFKLRPDATKPDGFVLESPIHRNLPDPVWHSKRYIAYARDILQPLILPKARQRMSATPISDDKTYVYPVAQFDVLLGEAKVAEVGQYRFTTYTSTEKPLLTKLLTSAATEENMKKSSWVFTAGYFNIDPDISAMLIKATPPATDAKETKLASRPCTVITASPWANGFYGSSGISGMLPAAYTLLSRRFLRRVSEAGKETSVQVKEWRKGTVNQPGGWTYHAKGLWLTLPPKRMQDGTTAIQPGPSVTLIGSSNYTKRSYSLDLEIGAMVVTGDNDLKKRLKAETDWLQENASVTTQDDLSRIERRVGFRVRVAMWLVERLGGAL